MIVVINHTINLGSFTNDYSDNVQGFIASLSLCFVSFVSFDECVLNSDNNVTDNIE